MKNNIFELIVGIIALLSGIGMTVLIVLALIKYIWG